ncbi:Disks large-associated protein [Dirofilaria immitis]
MGKYTAEPKIRPSAIGHFFSRIGSMRPRSKSPQDSSLYLSSDVVTPPIPTQLTSSVKNRANVKDEESNAENELHMSPPPKPKRHSSPFFRIIHRLSMNRKTRELSSVDQDAHNSFYLDPNELNKSHETVFSTSTVSTTYTSGDVLSRPTVSENDLRLITLRKDQEMERSVTALSMNTSGAIHSEDNFDVITRVPSYLRISCALNGYRRPYRNINESRQWDKTMPSKLPMSIVEARKLTFSQNNSNDNRKGITPEEMVNRNNSQMGDDISRTSAPVRQLVEHFDHLLENNSTEEMKNMGGADDSFRDENPAVPDEVHTAKPLNHPIAPQNSLAFSDQLYGAAYWHTNPNPSVAQQMHQAILKTSMESKPHISNQSEVSFGNGQLINEQIAERVKNENGINFVLPDGEAYRSLLMEARKNLQLLSDQAKNDLLKEEHMPEYAAGMLRTAIGKANLLLDKKMAKFEDLVKNHLGQNSNVQQVKLSDLSGYWALISIELKELETNFREITSLRENHWKLPELELSSMSIIDENRSDITKKIRSHSPMIANEKVAFEVQRRQVALAAAKRRQKELMKAEEEQHSERNDGEARMII